MTSSSFLRKMTLFELFVSVLTMLQLYHFCILFSNQGFPMPLLYGPLFWAMYQFLSGKSRAVIKRDFAVGNFPFAFFVVWYWMKGDNLDWNYFQWYLPVMILGQIGYPLAILYRLKGVESKGKGFVLLKQLMALGMGIFLFVGAVFLHHYLQVDVLMGIDPIHAIAVAMVFSVFMLLNYMYALWDSTEREIVEMPAEPELLITVDDELVEYCDSELTRAMEEERLFLDAKLTLDKLSTYIGISKNIISQYLHSQLGLNYYEWLAAYRIDYAKEILSEFGSEYKIEAVARASGFSSKTTFNRYFKERVGVLPSVYREQASFT